MRKVGYLTTLAALVICAGCASSEFGSPRTDKTERKLDNGLKVIFVEDEALPLVRFSLFIQHGSRVDGIGNSGVSSITAEMLTRGTKTKNATAQAAAFEMYGTELSTSASRDFVEISTQSLSDTWLEVYKLFWESILEPTFSADEFSKVQKEYVAGRKRALDQSPFLASQIFQQSVFGLHPYARPSGGNLRDLQTLRSRDVIKHYLRFYRPSQSILVVSGKIPSGLVDITKTLLKDWDDKSVDLDPVVLPQPIVGRQVLLAVKNDAKQSEVYIGHLGPRRNVADYMALQVAMSLLSGPMESRLMNEIRVKNGLAYGISSDSSGGYDVGSFVVNTSTRHEKVGEVITRTVRELERFVADGVGIQELNDMKVYLAGNWIRGTESTTVQGKNFARLSMYGVPDSYAEDYLKNLSKMTVDDVNNAIRKYLNPQNLKFVVVGPQAPLVSQLRTIGTLEIKEAKTIAQ
jgi:zinc protease